MGGDVDRRWAGHGADLGGAGGGFASDPPHLLGHRQVLWTGLPGPNLHLLVACAILDMERDTLMLSGFGSNEILKVRPWLPPSPLPWRHISRV